MSAEDMHMVEYMCSYCGTKKILPKRLDAHHQENALVLYPVSNNTLRFRKNLLYSIKNGIGGRRYATLHCHAGKR